MGVGATAVGEERVGLIEQQHRVAVARLEKHRGDRLFALADPLRKEVGGAFDDDRFPHRAGDRMGQFALAGPGRAVEEERPVGVAGERRNEQLRVDVEVEKGEIEFGRGRGARQPPFAQKRQARTERPFRSRERSDLGSAACRRPRRDPARHLRRLGK